jgi:hypothetical protein
MLRYLILLSGEFVLVGTFEEPKEKGGMAQKQTIIEANARLFDVAVANFGICHTHRLLDNRRTPCRSTGSNCRDTWRLR